VLHGISKHSIYLLFACIPEVSSIDQIFICCHIFKKCRIVREWTFYHYHDPIELILHGDALNHSGNLIFAYDACQILIKTVTVLFP
jgi:hypothetical protein